MGTVLRTRDGVKPVFVSPGHRVTIRRAAGLVLAATTRYRLPEPTRRSLLRAIVAFELPVLRVEGKFKLSQNRPEGDARRVADALRGSEEPGARALGAFMARRRRRAGMG